MSHGNVPVDMNRREERSAATGANRQECVIAELEDKVQSPVDAVIEIETARIRLGVNKNVVCKVAGINPEMYSYLLKMARLKKPLPEDCLKKIRRALQKLETISDRKTHATTTNNKG